MRIREGSQAKTGMAEEKETKGIDYQTWEFTGREYLEIAGISLGIAAAVNLLCYRAWWACIAVVPVGIVCFHTYRKNRIQRRKEELYDSFRDLIAWMHTALRSGYSMENAVLEAAGQLEQSLGKENILVQELRRMRHKMMISVPVEQLFQDLAVRSRIDDIATFASVLVIAKRTGGNVCEIFQNTWDIFCTRIDTMREIRAGVSSRRFEQNIMSVVPFGILGGRGGRRRRGRGCRFRCGGHDRGRGGRGQVERRNARRERAQADAGRQRDSRAARRQLIQRQPRKRAAGEIPHGILFIKHSCSSQLKILNCYTINHTMKKAPSARGRGAKNVLKNAEIFNIRVGRLLRIVILWKQLSGHLAVRGTVNRKKLYWSKILPQADPRTHHSCAYPGPGRTPAKRSCRLFRPSA